MLAKLLAAVLLPPRFVGARRKQYGKLEMWTNKAAKYTRVPREECLWLLAAHARRGPTVKAPSRPRYRPLLLLLSQLISSETRTWRFSREIFFAAKVARGPLRRLLLVKRLHLPHGGLETL